MSENDTIIPLSTTPKLVWQRTIILVGRAGAGMRTLANHIAGTNVFPDLPVTESQPEAYEVSCESQCGDYKYTFKLFETNGIDSDVFSNYFMNKRSDSFNLLLFVIRQGGGDHDQGDIRAMVSNLDDRAKEFSALVMTGCEGMQRSERKASLDVFRRDSKLKNFMAKGMYAVGFPEGCSRQDIMEGHEKDLDKLVKDSKEQLSVGDAFFPSSPANFMASWLSAVYNTAASRIRECVIL